MVETPIEQKPIEKDTVSFHFVSKIDEFNCMEYSNDDVIQLIVKTIIYKRGTIEEKFKILKEDPRIKKYSEYIFLNIFKRTLNVLEIRKKKKMLELEEKKYIRHIILNLITENGKLNKNEAFKIVKTKIFLDTPNFDAEIFKIINSVKERNIILAKFSIPTYLLPKKKSMYLIERKNEFILGSGPKYLNISSPVMFYNKKKIFGIGIIHSIFKEGIINNIYNILPINLITNDNMVHTEYIAECEYPVKNVPFCVISHEEQDFITKQLTGIIDHIYLGPRLVGDQLLKSSSDSFVWYKLSYESLLDMFEKRLILYGVPSSAKSILGVQFLRFLAMKDRKVIAIAPNNPNLAKFGLKLQSIGKSNPNWDLENISLKYLKKYGDAPVSNYDFIELGENNLMPDIETLNKRTVLTLINEVTESVQIKNIVALELVSNTITNVLRRASNESLLDPKDFQSNQVKALKRMANILLKWQSIGIKIDLKDEIFSDKNKSVGFYVNSELFLPELTYILMAEIFFNSEPCFDIKGEGLILMVDEIPLLMNLEGVLIKSQHLGNLFTQINKQGRNMGILLGSIIQDYTSKIQTNFLQQNLNDYSNFHLIIKNKKRLIKINNEYVLVPPVTNI